MKKTLTLLLAVIAACTVSARSFDGTQKIYLKANAVSWWTNDNCVQRAVLDNTTPVIGEVEDADRKIYAFTLPAGDYTTIRFERCESAEAAAWNATGEIVIPAEGNYVTAFDQNSTTATWDTYVPQGELVYHTYHIYVTNNTGWEAFYLYEWGTPNEISGTWPGADGSEFTFQVAEGENCALHLIFHNNIGEGVEGDQRVLFDITEARDYALIVTATEAVEGDLPSAVSNLSQQPTANGQKQMINGQLFIIRDGKTFNALGAEIK